MRLDTEPPAEIVEAFNSNLLRGSKKLLVLFLFNSESEMRLIRMHPEMMQADTTHGTNREKKELFTIASVDGNNCGFNAARAFIPNAQNWVFYTLFRECLPAFFGPVVTKRNRLMITDGCASEYVSFINSSGKDSIFPNSCLGLCYFHLVIQGWNKHVKSEFGDEYVGNVQKNAHLKSIQMWIKSWFFELESQEEYMFSRRLFLM